MTGLGQASVAVVGAGIAGLNAVYQLKKSGVTAALFEGASRVGGRIWTDRDSAGVPFERGGEFINEEHTDMRALAAEMGVELFPLYAHPDQRAPVIAYQVGGVAYTEGEFAAAVQPLAAQIRRDEAAFGTERLDRMTVRAYLDGTGLDGWARDMVELFVTAEYGLESDRVSAWALREIGQVSAAHPGIVHDGYGKYCARGGSEAITQALSRQVEDQIHLDHRLEAIRETGGRFHLSFEGRPDAAVEHLVLALPLSTLRRVDLSGITLSPKKRRAINELGMATNAKVIVGCAPRVRASHGLSEVFSGEAGGFVWENARYNESTAVGSLTVYRGGAAGAHVSQASVEAETELVAALDAAFPGFARARTGEIIGVNWSNHPWSLGSYSCLMPGQASDFGDALTAPEGRIVFAGEHAGGRFRGFMNGAAMSGRLAAAQVLAHLNRI
ncbi:MAG: FAD-dependent oxidoreductase [Armatimonadota bacterium]|nr:FAD-dependent oxidoreductase [Armatimonadota bacterium]